MLKDMIRQGDDMFIVIESNIDEQYVFKFNDQDQALAKFAELIRYARKHGGCSVELFQADLLDSEHQPERR